MEPKDKQVVMLENEIEEVKYNIETCEEHIARLPDGDARRQFEEDRAELQKGLEALERKLAGLKDAGLDHDLSQ
ncbi:MAG: hypothetical protein HY077_04290 [Elusimicrobia bacterium]|nr:hypothetical protein [Elusimicrobiota bacterium]